MKTLGYRLHRGKIMMLEEGANYTYGPLKTVSVFIDELEGNPSVKYHLVAHTDRLKELLSSDTCALVPQIKFDDNTIEVSGGKFFKLNLRGWSDEPPHKIGGAFTSARVFFKYDWKCTPKAEVFWMSFCNSFPNLIERTRVLNKFYQCLFPKAMGHKIPKLTFLGPQDSGKSTWYEILLAFMGREDLAFIGHEKNFPLSMLSENTKLVIMDDWSKKKIVVDVLKQVFQGGKLAIAKKYKEMQTCQ